MENPTRRISEPGWLWYAAPVPRRLFSLLASPFFVLWAALLAGTLALPSLGVGLALDDFILRGKLEGHVPMPKGSSAYLELFRFLPGDRVQVQALIENGTVPWWTGPAIKAAFFRPLTVATHQLDQTLWPSAVELHHAHSLLWFALGVALAVLFFRRLLPPVAAGLAGLMFAVDDAHSMPACWLSSRNALLAFAFGTAALLLHRRWRQTRERRCLFGSLGAMLAALCSSEAALGALAYLVAYQLTLDPGSMRTRLLGLLPQTLLLAVFAAVYLRLGFGAGESGLYLDPLRNPGTFAEALLERIPILALSQLGQQSADGWLYLPRWFQLTMTGLGLGVLAWTAWLCAPSLRRDPLTRFFALGLMLSLVPVCGTFPMDRLLLFSGLGAFGLIARQLDRLGWFATGAAATPPWRRRSLKLLLVLHLVVAAPLLPLRIVGFSALCQRLNEGALALSAPGNALEQTYVLLAGLEIPYITIALTRLDAGLPVPRRLALLAPLLSDLEVRRPDANTLRIRPDGGFYSHHGERLFRGDDRPFRRGDRVMTRDYQAEVLSVTPDGRPAEVAFHFRTPLSDPSLPFFFVEDGHPRPFPVPAIGEVRNVKSGFPAFSQILTWLTGTPRPQREAR